MSKNGFERACVVWHERAPTGVWDHVRGGNDSERHSSHSTRDWPMGYTESRIVLSHKESKEHVMLRVLAITRMLYTQNLRYPRCRFPMRMLCIYGTARYETSQTGVTSRYQLQREENSSAFPQDCNVFTTLSITCVSTAHGPRFDAHGTWPERN